MGALRRLQALIRRFRGDVAGVAAIEFAMVFPVMLLVYAGSIEATTLLSIDRRVQTVASTLGDLVSRSNKKIAACDLKTLFLAAGGIMAPHPTNVLQQVVSAVNVAADGKTTTVAWSSASGTGAEQRQVGSSFQLPKAMLDISRGNLVVVAEASYTYMPITRLVYDQGIALRRENFFLPRFTGGLVIDPASLASCPG